MKPTTRHFKQELPRHLHNLQMRRNIMKATWHSLSKRAQVVSEVPEWESLREQAHQIKKQIIDDLEANLKKFEENARSKGIEVLFAKDAREAIRFTLEIVERHGINRIVKSKSMLTEELNFNEAMEAHNLEVVETDLGEFIIQLAKEPPSHLTGPAVHKSRQEIAQLFQEKLGIPYSEDPQHLTRVARKLLREKFLTADMGVTGANFGIIDNGSIAIVENEGNARLCASLPPVHLAFIGMERLIPGYSDLPLFLKLLARSSTGQKMTTYVSTIDGPRSPNSLDGPENVYYIIVDNRRSTFLEDEHLKQALYCIRCGACYNTCPVYQNIGGHAYGWVYQGPIGAVITPQLLGLKEAPDLPFASSLCGSCTDICPVKIPLHHLLLYQRKRIVEAGLTQTGEPTAIQLISRFLRSSSLYSWLNSTAYLFQKITGGKLPLPGWSKIHTPPRIEKPTFKEWWQKHHTTTESSNE
ncbi:MAG: iron-sulfur cluster-binding protein [Calditrichaeota bacterium]|nr:MAG: iron-sulfur cluster-binding protein [Calditrichota bacterium]